MKYNLFKLKQQGSANNDIYSIPNNGAMDGMSNQCFWISILHYLKIQNPNLTLQELRDTASNNNSTAINGEQDMFDSGLHMQAAQRIAEVYDLQIEVYASDGDGNNWLQGGVLMDRIGRGANRIALISFGAHFQLITRFDGVINIERMFNDTERKTKFKPDLALAMSVKASHKYDHNNAEINNLITHIIHLQQSVKNNTNNITYFNNMILQLSEDKANLSSTQKLLQQEFNVDISDQVTSVDTYIENTHKSISKLVSDSSDSNDVIQLLLAEMNKLLARSGKK